MKFQRIIRLLALGAIVTLGAGAVSAQTSYTESFTNSNQKDNANTTAHWSGVNDDLSFYPFVVEEFASANGLFTGGLRVTTYGEYVYVGAGSAGMQILSVDAGPVTLVSATSTSGYTRGIAIAGQRAYLADGLSGLQVYDISNKNSPVFAGVYDTAEYAWDVAVAGKLAFVADGNSGLSIIDIDNPAAPTLVSSLALTGRSTGVSIAGNMVYVSSGISGLHAVDVSNPAAPVLVGTHNTPGAAYAADIQGDFAYVADGGSGLVVVDISDPASLSEAGLLVLSDFAQSVSIAGDRAYLSAANAGVEVIDISDPLNPVLVQTAAPLVSSNTAGVCVAGNWLYTVDSASGLVAYEVASIIPPALAGQVGLGSSPYDVCVVGDIAYVASASSGLEVVDITDVSSPQVIGSVSVGGSATRVELAGDHAFVAVSGGTFKVVDVSNPLSPVVVGVSATSSSSYDIALNGDHVYLTSGFGGMEIQDISDPTNPSLVGTYVATDPVSAIAVAGDFAFLGDTNWGVTVVDISNPATPVFVTNFGAGQVVKDMELFGDYLYICLQNFGFRVVDVSNPAAPIGGPIISVTGTAEQVSFFGEYACVANSSGLTRVFDITTPMLPVIVESYDGPGSQRGVDVAGNYAFVVGYQGLEVLQVMQSDESLDLNKAQSRRIYVNDDSALLARIVPTMTGAADWELSSDAGVTWLPAQDKNWVHFDATTNDIRWRSFLNWDIGGTAVDELVVEWVYETGTITSVNDIAGDQGGQVRLEWQRSGHDFVGDSQQIVEYAIYRKVVAGSEAALAKSSLQNMSPLVRDHSKAAAAAGWDFVTTVPVRAQDSYAVVVPTLADSSLTGGQHFSTFMVSALTAVPGVFFDSAPDSGYSVDNLAPSVPQGLAANYQASSVNLDWDDALESDFRYFRVYRDNDPYFVPAPEFLVQEVVSSVWVDATANSWDQYYLVTAVDFAGNESLPGSTMIVSDVPGEGAIRQYALNNAAPNPFNPATVLSFELPAQSEVDLAVYDLAGRKIVTLVQETREAGRHQISWNGRSGNGELVASGIYLYHLKAGAFQETKRMTLLK